ncbi:unnamed protein product [Diamesa serratosioi]
MRIIFLIFLVFASVMNIWTFAVADEESTIQSSSAQSSTEPSNVILNTTLITTKEASTVKSNVTKLLKSPSLEKTLLVSDDCDEQLLIYDDKIAELEIKVQTYANQKKALKSVMKIVLELLMNEVSLGTDDELDKKS